MSEQSTRGRQGFASMDDERQREIASKGGRSVPNHERSFSKDHRLAAEAGRKGGRSIAAADRSFSRDHQLAAEAGRKGGEASHSSGHGEGSHGGSGNLAQNRERAADTGRKGGQHQVTGSLEECVRSRSEHGRGRRAI
jgi:uncharacterized protein